MPKSYTSILQKLVEEAEGQGQKHYRLTINDDRAEFGLPPALRSAPKGFEQAKLDGFGGSSGQIQPSTRKVGGRTGTENKQLQLPSSSTIQSAAYFPDKQYLLVSFKSGATYSYNGVPVDTVFAWEEAASAGSWFYYNIRMSFRYQKM